MTGGPFGVPPVSCSGRVFDNATPYARIRSGHSQKKSPPSSRLSVTALRSLVERKGATCIVARLARLRAQASVSTTPRGSGAVGGWPIGLTMNTSLPVIPAMEWNAAVQMNAILSTVNQYLGAHRRSC